MHPKTSAHLSLQSCPLYFMFHDVAKVILFYALITSQHLRFHSDLKSAHECLHILAINLTSSVSCLSHLACGAQDKSNDFLVPENCSALSCSSTLTNMPPSGTLLHLANSYFSFKSTFCMPPGLSSFPHLRSRYATYE